METTALSAALNWRWLKTKGVVLSDWLIQTPNHDQQSHQRNQKSLLIGMISDLLFHMS